MTTDIGKWLWHYPEVMKVLTFMTVYGEIFGALALLLPFRKGLLRSGAIVWFALLQVGINVSLHVGLFGLISVVITLGLLPPWFWQQGAKWRGQRWAR